MSYVLEAFIARTDDLKVIQNTYPFAALTNLDQGFSLIPMTEELFKKISNAPTQSSLPESNSSNPLFEYLNTPLEQTILKLIKKRTIGYCEAEYFEGQGGQIAVLWQNGARVKLYEFGQNAINLLLKDLGVIPTPAKDEFDTLELGRNRKTEQWRQK